MTGFRYGVGIMVAGMLAAQPCLAADDLSAMGRSDRGMGAFAGLNVKLPLTGGKPAKASARLQLTPEFSTRSLQTGSIRTLRPAGLELGAGASGKPALYVGGQDAREMRTKLGVGGSTTTALVIVGGVILVLVVIAATQVPVWPDPPG